MRSVRNDEDLHILEKPAGRPKTVALIAVDLVERFSDRHAPAFELDMYKGQPVNKDGNVVTVFISSRVVFVLVDDLQRVGVYIDFVDQGDVFGESVVSFEINAAVAFLYFSRLFGDALVRIGEMYRKESLPFGVGEPNPVQAFELFA